ncbi:MAG: LysR family transcriptional regulator [Firmicutes bacterium]|nr:LysR family transcriptional regulator [Bacillota bacterium]
MNFDQLRYFTTIAETLNYSHSSQLLNVTQPALSLSISRLEEEIGYPLFVKKGRNIELSPYGTKFYEHANSILNNMKVALSDLEAIAGNTSQTLAIALNICFNYDYINEIIAAFCKENPDCDTDIMIMDFSDIMPALKQGYLPFALTHFSENVAASENLGIVPVAKYPLFAFVSEKNPLAKEDIITVPMLHESNLLVNTFKFKESVLTSRVKGYEARKITVVADMSTMIEMTANNEGVMTGNFALTDEMKEKGIVRKPYDNRITNYALVWNNNRIFSNIESKFLEFLQNYVKNHPLDITTV